MADRAAEWARAGNDHVAVAARADESPATVAPGEGGPAAGLLRPSQVPVPGATTWPARVPAPAGDRVYRRLTQARPRGAATGPARPSSVPARPVPDLLRGSGRLLEAPVRAEMEARLGADFSQVRVHTGSAAHASAAELGARAYTVGDHVVIGAGGADKHTLAHELTHVIQQRQGAVAGTDYGGGLKVSDPSDSYEKAAEASAARALRGPLSQRPAAASTPEFWAARPAPAIQRMSLKQSRVVTDIEESIDVELRAADGPAHGALYHPAGLVMRGAKSRAEALRWAMLTIKTIGKAAQSIPGAKFLSLYTLWEYLQANQNNDRYKIGELLTGYPIVDEGGRPFADEDFMHWRKDFNQKYVAQQGGATRDNLDGLRGNEDLRMFIDPFQFEVFVGYDDRYIGNLLRVKVEFGYSYNGYVIQVEDDERGVKASMQTRPKYGASQYGAETGTEPGMPATYSQTHHSSGYQRLGWLIDKVGRDQATLAENEEGIDAYTKVIGEGARWDCVAAMGTKVSDSTEFYFRPVEGVDEWAYLTFEHLWANWKAFGTKFGISDTEVKEKMREEPLRSLVRTTTDPADLEGGYDLEAYSRHPVEVQPNNG